MIDSSGIRVSNERGKAIQLMKAPKDQSELRSFLGMVNYFGKFFPHMSSHTPPLNEMLKKIQNGTGHQRKKVLFKE